MLVYGDAARTEPGAAVLDRIAAGLATLAQEAPGLARHGRLVALFIEAAMLAQGLADRDFEARASDRRTPAGEAATALVLALAARVAVSWRGGFGEGGPAPVAEIAAVRAAMPEGALSLRQPEGYAFYALYPEQVLEAASRLPAGDWRVVGIRSIGTGLAALAAVALGAPPPLTVRPVGHPFRRTLALDEGLRRELAGHAGPFAIVDEGPGLSGSSFGAVADTLEALGVARERIAFLPGHGGDLGPEASDTHRARWREARRPVADFGALFLDGAPERRLATWFADIAGPAIAPLEEVSGGRWRALRYASEADWPAADPQNERRKYLLTTAGGRYLLKFSGLGLGEAETFALARRLHAAGFTPEPLALRHGVLAERWVDAAPLRPAEMGERFVAHLGRYLAFRRTLPGRPEGGADPRLLLTMMTRNAGLALGEDAAKALDRAWAPRLARLAAAANPVAIDGRLDDAEWLVRDDGRFLKADALDHHAAHDLVGCQDIAWDVAGAITEFGLAPREAETLCRQVGGVDPDLLALHRRAYPAFRLGAATQAASSAGWDPAEAQRLEARAAGYARALAALL